MSPPSLTKRVENLEKTVSGPAGSVTQVELLRSDVSSIGADLRSFRTEFQQFSGETRAEFSAVRDEMQAGFAAIRGEMRTEFVAVRQEIGDLRAEMNTRFETVDRRFTTLEASLDQTRTEMRVLHEEVISRISLLAESLGGGTTY